MGSCIYTIYRGYINLFYGVKGEESTRGDWEGFLGSQKYNGFII